MERPIITTKLYTPPPPVTIIHRPALLARLDQGLAGKLTLLTAPAGYGKSTLISRWVSAVGLPVAWLTLDEHDNDELRFLTYLVAAFQRIDAACGGQTLALLRSPQAPPTETLLTTLINEVALLPQPSLLVLDDYHLLTAAEVHGIVNFLLAHLPPTLHLVLIGRSEPPLALARLRARGDLLTLAAADLRFSRAEVAEFFAKLDHTPLPSALVAALEQQTEGWAAGLRLAAVVLQGIDPAIRPAVRVEEFANWLTTFRGDDRHLFDYLTEEVFARLAPARQTFLVQTAILERLCGALCDAVTGQQGSQTLLEELARENLFLLPLDNQRHWYRYHSLFADFLRHRLQQLPPDQVAAHHRRAAGWYAAQGFAEAAIEHALAAHDHPLAAQLIEENVIRLARSNEINRLGQWLAQLPVALRQDRPLLAFAQAGAALLTAQFHEAKQWVATAERALVALPPPVTLPLSRPVLQGYLDALRCTAMVNLHDAVDEIIAIAERALAHLPADEHFLRGAVALNLGDAYARQRDTLRAADAFAAAVALTQESGNLTVHLAALGSQGGLYEHQGELQQAAQIYQQAIAIGQAWGQATGQPHPATGKALAFYANILCQWQRLAEAEQHAMMAIECCKRWGHRQHLVDSYLALVNSLQAQGKAAEAAAARTAARLVAGEQGQHVPLAALPATPQSAVAVAFAPPSRIAPAAPIAMPSEPLPEPLSERERDVLRLLADDLTYEAISATLIISLNTVRTHTKNIYSKLNVNRRSQALLRARELGLL
jgi:LuxR family maltose regulon positive regulatory protein